jgi:predicted HicB family RNase H-like nuclease
MIWNNCELFLQTKHLEYDRSGELLSFHPFIVDIGSVNYSDKDQVFFGKIEGINGLVNFEGESVKELTEAFHEAVDDYLAYCEDEGIEPDKSYTGVLNVRLTPAIHRQIAMLALQAGISINAYIKETLEEKVEEAVVS